MKNLFLDRKFIIILFSAIFVLLLVLQLVTPKCQREDKLIKIEKGMGWGEIAQKLKNEGLIINKWFFVLYVWARGYNNHLQAGEYLLNPQMGIPKIAKIIAFGEIAPNYVKVTIPEGWTNKQIEERLIASGVLKQDDKLPKTDEGYLFPDTYFFEKNSSIETVVKKMRDNFDKKIESLDLRGRNMYDILKMASILEKEVISDEDRTIASGIFWKRIQNNYPLESCATIAYILGKEKIQYSYEDTRIKSPYNTYLNIGLPPTPINNPGLSAIKAAINPRQTDYNFFLTDPATGNTIFSRTLDEHNANKVKYLDKNESVLRKILLYYYNPDKDKDESGNTKCSRDGLMVVEREIPITKTPIQDTINLLLKGEDSAEYPLEGFSLAEANLKADGTLILKFNDSLNKTSGGSCRAGILWFQIEATAKQFSEVKRVEFLPEYIFQP